LNLEGDSLRLEGGLGESRRGAAHSKAQERRDKSVPERGHCNSGREGRRGD